MATHTPGPWSINSSGAEIVEGRGIVIAEVFDRGSETPRPQANARLIAAAPDMLAALKQIEGEMRAGLGSSYGETREQVRRAIAKAEG